MAMTDDERTKVWNEAVRECARVAAGHAEGFDFQKALAECRDGDYGTASGRLAASKDVLKLLTAPHVSRSVEDTDGLLVMGRSGETKSVIMDRAYRHCASTTWENDRVQICIRRGSFEDYASAQSLAFRTTTIAVGEGELVSIGLDDGSVTSIPHSEVLGFWKIPVHEKRMNSAEVCQEVATGTLVCTYRGYDRYLDPIPQSRDGRTAA